MNICIIGGGGWGLALAKLLAENGHTPLVWEYNPIYFQELIEKHTNYQLLKNVVLPNTVSFTNEFATIAEHDPDLIILSTPSQFIRKVLKSIPREVSQQIWQSHRLKAIVNVAKGIEENSLKTIDAILYDELPSVSHDKICVLSGPSHAEEVAQGIPTTVVIAGNDQDLLIWLQSVFSNEYFRVYRSTDVIGVEIGGAVKNIIAIAAGIVSGLGFGDNTIGALLTRGIVEIARLGVKMDAQRETFLGLSGIGDLITTATSQHSRNRYVGYQIGIGKTPNEVLQGMIMVAEGVASTRSVYQLANKMGVELPIVTQVFQILFEAKDPKQAIQDLMLRELKSEF